MTGPYVTAKLDVSFVLECKDKDGNVLKTIPVTGALEVPLSEEKPDEKPDALA